MTSKRSWSAIRVLAALGLLVSTIGCGAISTKTPPTETVADLCVIAKPISYSASGDTAETVEQVRSHNAAWCEVCGDHPLCP